jgi:hypothetical protein
MWSLGIILYELTTLNVPFKSNTLLGLAKVVLTGKYEPIPADYSSSLNRCISWLLNIQYVKRPNIAQLIDFVEKKTNILYRGDGIVFNGESFNNNFNINNNINNNNNKNGNFIENKKLSYEDKKNMVENNNIEKKENKKINNINSDSDNDEDSLVKEKKTNFLKKLNNDKKNIENKINNNNNNENNENIFVNIDMQKISSVQRRENLNLRKFLKMKEFLTSSNNVNNNNNNNNINNINNNNTEHEKLGSIENLIKLCREKIKFLDFYLDKNDSSNIKKNDAIKFLIIF